METTARAKRQPVKVFMEHNAPRGEYSPVGEHVYEWEYEENGVIKKESKNVFEEIQSYGGFTDYKKRIKEGTYDPSGNSIYRDVSNLQMDAVDRVQFIEFIGSLSENEIATILEQRAQGSNEKIETGQTVQENVSETPQGETNVSNTINTSDTGGTN